MPVIIPERDHELLAESWSWSSTDRSPAAF